MTRSPDGSTTTTRTILIPGFGCARLASSDAPINPPRCPVKRGQHHLPFHLSPSGCSPGGTTLGPDHCGLFILWRDISSRDPKDGPGVLLRTTPAGLEAHGIEPDSADVAAAEPARATGEDTRRPEATEPATGPDSAPVRKTREGTKQAQLVAMLRRPKGAIITEVVAATGWQPRTVRGAPAGALKERLGLAVISEKIDDDRVYRIAS